jgi:uncharacterized protein
MALPNLERQTSIDAVRGFAVLGILLMNIVGMGLPAFAYLDPTHAGGAEGTNLWTWAINFVLTDGKMRGLFTMLFGASTLLIAERAEGGPLGPAATHYRRMFWLFVFGMAHAYFLWWGDILVTYALAGLAVFLFRKRSARALIMIGAVGLIGLFMLSIAEAMHAVDLKAAAAAPGASAAALQAWQAASLTIEAPPGLKEAELAGFGGDFASALAIRTQLALLLQTVFMPTALAEAVAQMLIGMGLYRMGFFSLKWTSRAYAGMAAFGYLVAAPATAWMAWSAWASGFDSTQLHLMGALSAAPRPFVALAHASLILLIVRSAAVSWLVDRFAAAGRMALSNYLGTSIITTLVFCGFGFGLYGELQRFELLYVVAGVWAFILLWSKPWLARFQYGPFEWAWRSLVRWRIEPFRKPAPA